MHQNHTSLKDASTLLLSDGGLARNQNPGYRSPNPVGLSRDNPPPEGLITKRMRHRHIRRAENRSRLLRRRWNNAELLHQAEMIAYSPMRGELAIFDGEDVDIVENNLLAGRRDTHEIAQVGAVEDFVRHHPVAFSQLLLNLEAQVGESVEQVSEEGSHALSRGRVRPAAVVDEIGTEHFINEVRVVLVLHFLDKAAHNILVLLQSHR